MYTNASKGRLLILTFEGCYRTIPNFLRQFSKATCIIQIYEYYLMNETIRIITAMILIMGPAVTILSIQTVSEGPISTSRSNIKALRTDASGDDSQVTSQDIDTENHYLYG